jgi:hypothetical protein
MRSPRWPIVFAGILAGTLLAYGLEQLHLNAFRDVRDKLTVAESKVRELGPVKIPVDAYEKDRARLEEQLRFIEDERERQRCLAPVLASLDFERRGAVVESAVLDGTTLALVGRAESQADVDALATGLRGAPWARAIRAGSARGSGRSLRFGVLATVEPPACSAEAQVAASSRAAGR